MSQNSIPIANQPGEEEKDSFHLLFFDHPLPMWVYDLETLVFLEVNHAAVKKYGYTRAEFLSMTLADIHPAEEVSRLFEDVERKRPALSYAGEWRHLLKDGAVIDVDITSLKMVFKGCQAALATAQDITERKQGEQERNLLAHMLTNSLNEIYLFDADSLRFRFVNRGALNNLQFSLDQMQQMTPLDIKPEIDPESFAQLLAPLRTDEKQEQVFQTVHQRADGTLYPVEVHLQLFKEARVFLAVLLDITDRKQAEEALRESEARNCAILNALPDLMFIHDREGTYLDYLAASPEMLFVPPEQFLGKKVRDIFPPELASDLTSAIENAFATGELQTCEYQLPISGRSRAFEARIVPYGSDKVLSIIREVTERVQAEQALTESEARFAAIFRANPGAVALTRLEDNRLADVNQAWQEITGYTRAEAIDHSPVELNLWVDIAQRERLVEAIRQHGKARSEMLLRRKTGEARDLLMSAEQVELAGKPYLLTMAQDITKRKRAEEALRVALVKYQTLFNSFPLGITVSDEAGNILETNPIAGQLLGVPPEEHTQRKIDGPEWQIVRPDGSPIPAGEYASVRALKEQRLVENSEMGIVRPDGSTIWISATAAPLPLEGYGVVITYGDITDRKHAEEALRQSEERHRQVSGLMSDYIYSVLASPDGSALIEWVSGALEGITGYGMEEINHLPGGFSALLLPEDLESVIRQQPRLFEQGSLSTEYRIRRKDGEVRWLRDYMRFVAGEGVGKPARLIGAVQDISIRKQAEEALRALSSRQEALLASIPDIVMEVDQRKIYTWANPAGMEFFGPDVVGQEAAAYFEGNQETYQVVQPLFNGDENTIYVESWQRRKDGEKRLLAWWCRTLKNEHNQVIGALSSARDITERKRAEEEIRQRSEELATINAFGREVGNSLSLSNTTACALNGIMEAIQPDLAYLFLREGQTLALKETLLRNKGAAAPVIPAHRVGECMCGLAAQENRALFSRDFFNDWRCTWDECKKFGVKSFAALPLRGVEEVSGVLGFGSLTERDFEQQAEFLETLASQVSAALVNARLFETVQEHAAQLEQRVEERTRELQEAQEKLLRQERLAVMGQLAGGVGHELRNPLGVINNAIYYLRLVQPEAEEKVREYLSIIEAETRNADKIITDLLDFSRVKSVEREPVAAQDLLARALERFPAPRGVRVKLDLPDDLPLAYVDARQIIQVLGNLTVNACQAMRGKGKLDLIARVKKRESQAYLALSVRDNGPGIPHENLDKLFEPLFTTKPKGIGLGLAVSQKLAEANQGWIEIASQVGKGATFTLYLPAYEEEA